MPWANSPLPHSRVTGKNATDPVTRIPKANTPTPDPIPPETGMLVEAKSFVAGKILASNSAFVMAYGGPDAFLDAATDNPVLSGYVLDLIGWGWLWFWYNSMFSEEGDRYWTQRQAAENMIDTLVPAFVGMANGALEVPRNEGAVIRGRVSNMDAWDFS